MAIPDPLTITWYYGPTVNGPWHEAGTSANPVSVLLGTPQTAPLYHTLVHLGCENAAATTALMCQNTRLAATQPIRRRMALTRSNLMEVCRMKFIHKWLDNRGALFVSTFFLMWPLLAHGQGRHGGGGDMWPFTLNVNAYQCPSADQALFWMRIEQIWLPSSSKDWCTAGAAGTHAFRVKPGASELLTLMPIEAILPDDGEVSLGWNIWSNDPILINGQSHPSTNPEHGEDANVQDTTFLIETMPLLELMTVTFDGYSLVQDHGSAYDMPHWQNTPAPSYQPSPVAYVRNSLMQAALIFSVDAPKNGSGTVYVTGEGSNGLTFPPTVMQIVQGVATVTLGCEATPGKAGCLPDQIDLIDPLTVTWSYAPTANGPWKKAGSSSNPVYVLWAPPGERPLIHTVAHVGCEAAKGMTGVAGTADDVPVLDAIWAKFKTLAIRRVSDGRLLTYYGFFDSNGDGIWTPGEDTNKNNPDTNQITDAAGLIRTGNGQCHSWAEFMYDVMQAQGISTINGHSSVIVGLEIKNPEDGNLAFAINNWTKSGVSPREIVPDIYTDAGIDGSLAKIPDPEKNEATDAPGASGQGSSPNPPWMFGNHYIVKMNGQYYDPSYGLGSYLDRKIYEDEAFAGKIYYDTTKKKIYLIDLPVNNNDMADTSDEINSYTN